MRNSVGCARGGCNLVNRSEGKQQCSSNLGNLAGSVANVRIDPSLMARLRFILLPTGISITAEHRRPRRFWD